MFKYCFQPQQKYLCMGEGNHHLCCVFFPNSAKSPQSPLQLVGCYFSYCGSSSASAHQAVVVWENRKFVSVKNQRGYSVIKIRKKVPYCQKSFFCSPSHFRALKNLLQCGFEPMYKEKLTHDGEKFTLTAKPSCIT